MVFEIEVFGGVCVVVSCSTNKRLLDRAAHASISNTARVQGVGVEPALLQPGWTRPAVEPRHLIAEERAHRELLEGRVPFAISCPPRGARRKRSETPSNAELEHRPGGNRCGHARLRRLDEIAVMHV